MKPSSIWKRKISWLVLAASVLVILAAVIFRPRKKSDSLQVPLGVEQAAIVTFSGPPITVAPYKWGVAVNARIAKATEQDGARIYDVRYIVNREGTFDLKDYLIAEDGRALEGLPSFQFHGDPKLSKQLDTRIQETEEVTIDVGGHYYATLTGLGIAWIAWLLLLIFYKRGKTPPLVALGPPEPTPAELLRAFLGQLEAGTLDAAGKARLEMMLLRHWRGQLASPGTTMSATLDEIRRNEETGALQRRLQNWLHQPASAVGREEIAAILTRCIQDETKAGEGVLA